MYMDKEREQHVSDLLWKVIQTTRQAKRLGVLSGYEWAAIKNPAKLALRDWHLYTHRSRIGQEAAARQRLMQYRMYLDMLEHTARSIRERRRGSDKLMEEVLTMLSQVRDQSPSL